MRRGRVGALLLLGVLAVGLPGAMKSFIWEIGEGKNTGFVLGSIHLLKKEMYPLSPAIEAAFAASDVLVLEVDLSGDRMNRLSLQLMGRGMYQDDRTLKDELSESAYTRVKTQLQERYGIDIALYHQFKPWFLALTVESIELLRMGFDPKYGVDMVFLRRAEGKKDILGLETAEFQMELFQSLSGTEGETFLLHTLEEVDREKQHLDEIVESWLRGDAVRIEEILNEVVTDQPDLRALNRRLLDDRNLSMADKIAGFLETGRRHFVVVGAAHLVGPKGIIRLLSGRGIRVRQL